MSCKCEHCKNMFSNKMNLKIHQNNAKYCLKIQGKYQPEKKEFICDGCERIFGRKHDLKRHISICKKYLNNKIYKKNNDILEKKILELESDNKILSLQLKEQKELVKEQKELVKEQKEITKEITKEYKETIKELQDKLGDVAIKAVSRPTTTNTKNTINNFVQQLQPITDSTFSDSVQNLTIEHIRKGAEGYAQYALEHPLKDRIICVDFARKKMKFKDPEDNVVTDPDMTKISKKFFESIKEKNQELIDVYVEEVKERYSDDAISEFTIMAEITDCEIGVSNGCKGKKTDFHNDFVKEVCSNTVK